MSVCFSCSAFTDHYDPARLVHDASCISLRHASPAGVEGRNPVGPATDRVPLLSRWGDTQRENRRRVGVAPGRVPGPSAPNFPRVLP